MSNEGPEGLVVLVGLGNPGAEYARQRHNLGFMLIDALAQRWSVGALRQKFSSQFAKAHLDGRELVLLKPQTFMNRSGEALQPALAFFKATLAQVLVLHDELDLPWGSVRWKQGGGIAGHNGLRSIVQHCGGNDFLRLRLGIDKPSHGDRIGYVLGDFDPSERALLPEVLERAAGSVEVWLRDGLAAAMQRLHSEKETDPKKK